MSFTPSTIKFFSAPPIDGTDVDFAGTKNSNNEDNFAGTMIGFAVNGGISRLSVLVRRGIQ